MKRILVTGAGGFTWYNRVIEKHPALAGRGMSQSGVSTMTTPSIPPTKTCTKCGETFPATTEYFYTEKRVRDGLKTWCKRCHLAFQRQWRKGNPEKIYEQNSKYREENRAAVRERNRNYQKANPDKRREQNLRWQQANPDKLRTYNHNRRARIVQAEGQYTAKELQEQYKRQRGKCYWCGERLVKNNYHADHVVPLNRGGSNYISNIVCACQHCNTSKSDKLPHEWEGTDRLL